jgi:phosphomannomutase/phosphoglucomutase
MFEDKIFREYDIRGTVGVDFDEELAFWLGVSFAQVAKEIFAKLPTITIAVGMDCRLSGADLKAKLVEGIVSQDVRVLDIGVGPTPMLYYVVYTQAVQGGIQITGSHNPADQNGFKLMMGKSTLSGLAIKDLMLRIKAHASDTAGQSAGLSEERKKFVTCFDALTAYTNQLIEIFKTKIGKNKIKIVCDAGNGVGGLVGPKLLRALGCEVTELFSEPNGNFPNHHPDPTVLENLAQLQKTVIAQKADLGIGWDGDADRIGVVDEQGNPLYGDMLLTILGRQLVNEVRNPVIIGDVKCSDLMFKDLSNKGAVTVMSKTGHSLIKKKMKELNAHLAGEMSGHVFFGFNYFGFDDAMYATAKLVEILSHSKKKLSELLADLPKRVSTPEIRFDCPDEIKFKVAEQAQHGFPEYTTDTTDGVRIAFSHGWGLVRASNTQPILVFRFEADTEERLQEYQEIVVGRIKNIVNGF